MHVHLVFVAKYCHRVFDDDAIQRLRTIQGVSSRLLRKERTDLLQRYWKGVLWSPSYFASSCGGAPISIVRQYIEQQQTPH